MTFPVFSGRPTGYQGDKGQAYRVPGGRGVDQQGPRGSRVRLIGSLGVKGDVWGIPWSHRVDLMSVLMIHEAFMPVYKAR